MSSERSEADVGKERGITRRRALALIGAGGLALAAAGVRRLLGVQQSQAAAGKSQAPAERANRPGRVVIIRSPHAVLPSGEVRDEVIARMVEAALCKLSGEKDPRDAWRRFFDPRDIIGVKVNCLGAPTTRTNPSVAMAAASGLRSADIPASNIIIYDRRTDELSAAGYPVNESGDGIRCLGTDSVGYDEELTAVGEAASCYSRIVTQHCTALLNMPVLKDHDMAGITASLKNHFGSINNPNKMHINGCSPYVADVNLAPFIRRKQRLVICDALRVTYDGGPSLKPRTTAAYGAILAATDPVALDRVGWDIIDELRRGAGLPSLAAAGRAPRYVEVAGDAQHNLGVADLSRIERVTARVAQVNR
jgi:uncharacterized protein (DUF362 family)